MTNDDYEIWLEGLERVNYPRGVLPLETETLIVGGGIAGITCAYLLAKEGKRVVLLEKRKLGEWVTFCTTGFLTAAIDTDPVRLIKLFGEEKARLIFASHLEAIDNIESIIKSEKIECEFERCNNYIYANSKREEKNLIKMTEAFKKLNVKCESKKDNNLKFSKFSYIEMPNQAKFNVMKYLTSLAKIASEHGATIAEDTEVLSLNDQKSFVEVVVKDVGVIKAQKVFSATYDPFGKPAHLVHKTNMYRTYVLEYKLPAGSLTSSTYEDTLKPYHYFRIDRKNGFDRMIIGGADHLNVIKMNRELNFKTMRKYTKEIFRETFGHLAYEEIRHWSGPILEPVDGLAFIGELKDSNIFQAFAFSGNGMTYSYIASKIFLDKVTSQNNLYSKIYDIKRKISWRANIFG